MSSDIWKVELRSGPVCVKRALPRLRVAQVWEAPVERNRYEWGWMQAAARIVPGAAPRVLALRHPCEHRTGDVAFLDRPIGFAGINGPSTPPTYVATLSSLRTGCPIDF